MKDTLKKFEDVPVLIVGGGITGLTAALFLLQQGITPLLIEKHPATSVHPRSRGFDIRAMELLREIGLSDEIREAGKALGPAWGILRGDNLIGTLNKTIANADKKVTFPTQLAALKKLALLTPEDGARCTQDIAEPILLQSAIDRGARIFFQHELVRFENCSDKVIAWVKDRVSGEEHIITADYMIAADGSKSPIRKVLGIPVTGQGTIADFINIYFEADLTALVKGREFSLFLIDKPGLTGFLTSINNSDKWVFQWKADPPRDEGIDDAVMQGLIGVIRRAIGDEGLPVRILSVMSWKLMVNVAKQLQSGRIFIAGDAAHVMTPYGGKGANTGIQDVHNLAWKLAAVLKGAAGPRLLETYHAERYPVGEFYAVRSGKMAASNGLVNEKVVLEHMKSFIGLPDYRYQSTAVIGGRSAVIPETDMYELLGLPGTRMPHLWLDETKLQSTLDLIKGHFLVIQNVHDQANEKAITNLFSRLNLPLELVTIADHASLAEEWRAQLNGLEDDEVVLVRPDAFIAWKGIAATAGDQLEESIKQILAIV